MKLSPRYQKSRPHLPSLYRLPQVVGHLRCHACQVHLHTVRAQKILLAHCNYMLWWLKKNILRVLGNVFLAFKVCGKPAKEVISEASVPVP